MNRLCLALSLLLVTLMATLGSAGETLYNGIVLPDTWPPKGTVLTREPLALPPYLTAPPTVIPIDVGRQLFVDDFLVQDTTLTRTQHQTTWHPATPVLRPDQPWEERGGCKLSMVYSDGVWYDPADKLFKAFYMTPHPQRTTCLATSRDGVTWEKPDWGIQPGTNVVVADGDEGFRDSNTVWLDQAEQDPARRWKMFRVIVHEVRDGDALKSVNKWVTLHVSPDGVHWTKFGDSDELGDRSTFFYNPFRHKWVAGLRIGTKDVGRCRGYYESDSLEEALRWDPPPDHRNRWVPWIGADTLDPERHDLLLEDPVKPWDVPPVQLYNLDCVAYESLMLGLFAIWRGQPRDRMKPNELCVGYSRDGFHWSRPDRRAFLPVSEHYGDWNWGNVQSAGGCGLVVGDKLYFYCMGSTGQKGTKGWGTGSTGLATLRRDGFVSLDAGEKPGTLTTRPVRFGGKYLFVNVAAPQGELRVEVLDAAGQVIPPFSAASCNPVRGDSTLQAVTWTGAGDLARLAGQPVRFRFQLRQGSLYAFWVSPEASGASRGFVAAGGPGYTGPTDTVGRAALAAGQ